MRSCAIATAARASIGFSPMAARSACSSRPAQGMVQLVEKLEPAPLEAMRRGDDARPLRYALEPADEGNGDRQGRPAAGSGRPDRQGGVSRQRFGRQDAGRISWQGANRMHGGGRFQMAEAQWPSDVAIPACTRWWRSSTTKDGKELCRVAPRMVSAGWVQGY